MLGTCGFRCNIWSNEAESNAECTLVPTWCTHRAQLGHSGSQWAAPILVLSFDPG